MNAIKIRLQVQTGELVAHVEMMPYVRMPEIVMWGDRFFRHSGTAFLTPTYTEAFCAPLVDLTHEKTWAIPLAE